MPLDEIGLPRAADDAVLVDRGAPFPDEAVEDRAQRFPVLRRHERVEVIGAPDLRGRVPERVQQRPVHHSDPAVEADGHDEGGRGVEQELGKLLLPDPPGDRFLEERFRLLALADVADDGVITPVGHPAAVHLHEHPLPVGPFHLPLGHDDVSPFEQVEAQGLRRQGPGREKLADMPSDQPFSPDSENLLRTRVGVGDDALGRPLEDPVHRHLDEGAQAELAGEGLPKGPAALLRLPFETADRLPELPQRRLIGHDSP